MVLRRDGDLAHSSPHGARGVADRPAGELGDARGAVGAMLNRADAARTRLEDLEDLTTKGIDDLTGVDMAKAITDFTAQQSAYQAALKVGAQIIQPSLVDFLR
jgi:flagellar hook-associated protein 3 FlgL